MVRYYYFRILINFYVLLHFLDIYEIESVTDYFCVLFNFVLANCIDYGVRLILSQVTILISPISWYRGSIITNAKGHSNIYYPIALIDYCLKFVNWKEIT